MDGGVPAVCFPLVFAFPFDMSQATPEALREGWSAAAGVHGLTPSGWPTAPASVSPSSWPLCLHVTISFWNSPGLSGKWVFSFTSTSSVLRSCPPSSSDAFEMGFSSVGWETLGDWLYCAFFGVDHVLKGPPAQVCIRCRRKDWPAFTPGDLRVSLACLCSRVLATFSTDFAAGRHLRPAAFSVLRVCRVFTKTPRPQHTPGSPRGHAETWDVPQALRSHRQSTAQVLRDQLAGGRGGRQQALRGCVRLTALPPSARVL